jgi:hypothetical protein
MSERLVLGSPVDGLLDRLYARNVAQNDALATYFTTRAAEGSLDWNQFDRAKAEFCYHVCRALQARRVVRHNEHGQSCVVIGTESEPEKTRMARGHFAEAGLADLIDLREGDLRETLVDIEGPRARSSSVTTRCSFARHTGSTLTSSRIHATGCAR